MTTPPVPSSPDADNASKQTPMVRPKRELRAPNWLQFGIIIALLASAIFVAVNEHYLWGILLAVAGLAFGASYLLRRMVGDDYGRA